MYCFNYSKTRYDERVLSSNVTQTLYIKILVYIVAITLGCMR